MSVREGERAKEFYEFGPFRVDPEKESLLRAGELVPLTPKTFQVLLVLVRHSKEVVTKEDLMNTVWPDTYVEEANLSRNIFMLRKALGESPQDRYIITVPGRGYRLADRVHLVPEREISIVAANHTRVQVQVAETKPWGWISAGVILLLVITAGTFRLVSHRPAILGEKDTVVLADFANSTGDPVFDGTLRQGLEVQLEQSPFLSIVSEDRIQQVLRMMGQGHNAQLTPELAREICERTGSAAVLEGSIAPLGTRYVLGLRAKDCRTGDTLDDEQVQATKKEDILNALTQIAATLRTRVGESLSTIDKHDTPLAEAATSSLEALKAYSTGLKVLSATGSAAALPLFKRATEIDPQFAMAYAYLGRVYGDMGESVLSAEKTSKAYQLQDRASDREKFFIAASYDIQVTGNVSKAQQTCQLWAQTYPREMLPHALLGGIIYQVTGMYESAVEESTKAIELDPDFAVGYDILIYSYESLGRVEEAESTLQRASARKLEIPWFLLHRYRIAFLKADAPAMERVATQAERPGADEVSNQEAFVLAYAGQLRQARKMSERAAELALRNAQRETAALWEVGAAVQAAFLGNPLAARQSATESLELSNDREVEYGAALALALSADPIHSEKLAKDLEERFPEDTSVRVNYLPTLHALFALDQGKPAKAIELLQVAAPYELGVPESSIHGYFGALYPVYVRGEAYLVAHQGAEAVEEFQKILDHRGIVVSDPIGALAHLQLGRAYAIQGDTADADAAYQDFLTLWKDADPDIPILKQAKAEYAKLQQSPTLKP